HRVFDVWRTKWGDLVPGLREFDGSRARAVAEALVPATARGLDREALEAAIHSGLIAAYGDWVGGWSWATSEPGGGGPVRAWRCPANSLWREAETTREASVGRVVAAVEEWRAFLCELADLFASLEVATKDQPLGRAAEHAAARLLSVVLARTGAEDAWYGTF